VLVIAVAGVICGCDGPTAIHRWATYRKEWLESVLPLENGLPSRDCIRRVLLAVKPEVFQDCFDQWLRDAVATDETPQGQRLVAIDGKTCRGSASPARGLGALHVVSAWASEEGLALGQVATDAKSNEITAIPELLAKLSLDNTIVTIDAIGCQKAICEQIVGCGGDFVIAVKSNQEKLWTAIKTFFDEHVDRDLEDVQYRHQETEDASHGRVDVRTYYVAKVPNDFAPSADWPGVKAIGYTLRHTVGANGKDSFETRYFISSRYLSGKRFSEAVRSHWSIESMHWTLDVTMREDDSRTRERTLANNLSWLRRFAISLVKRHPANDSLRGKLLSCGYSTDFLTQVLIANKV
jgi:predicted transposase YbfD/YdcC